MLLLLTQARGKKRNMRAEAEHPAVLHWGPQKGLRRALLVPHAGHIQI